MLHTAAGRGSRRAPGRSRGDDGQGRGRAGRCRPGRRTIARLRLDLAKGPLAAGTVIVLDKVSRPPPREVEAVLAAVDACPGGSIGVLGDPRQSQPVDAGGVADDMDRRPMRALSPRPGSR